MNKLLTLTLLGVVLVTSYTEANNDYCYCDNPQCDPHYVPVGCYNDKKGSRDLEKLLFTQQPVDWPNYANNCCDLMCRCSQAAKMNGFMYFGIQNYKECWGGNSYGSHGASDRCYDCTFKACDKNKYCVGSGLVNYIYKVEDLSCDVLDHVRFMACREDSKKKRRLPTLSLTARDPTSPVFWVKIDWTNYNVFLPKLSCECAKKALAAGHRFFGLQYWGECWTATKHGKPKTNSKQCYNNCFKPCDPAKDKYCVGAAWTNAVYRFDRIYFLKNKGK